jgi:hypothetical protein
MKTLYLWVSGKGWTPFQYNELSELATEFEARNIKLGDLCELGNGCINNLTVICLTTLRRF